MEVNNLAIVWHDSNEPVYSAHFQPNSKGAVSERLVTGGGDNNVRVWKLRKVGDEVKVEYLSTLARHTQAVNAVRFDPKGEILATAGDDGTVLIWTLSETIVKEFGQEEDEDLRETWTLRHSCRSSTSEIYDIAWSPDSKYIITGSTDNVSRIYDVNTGQQVNMMSEHNHYVQGVAWDPLGQFIATQSADRSTHIYTLHSDSNDSVGVSPKVYYKISRTELPTRIRDKVLEEIPQKSNEENIEASDVSDIISIDSPSAITATDTSIPSEITSTEQNVDEYQSKSLNFKSVKSSMLYHTENLESFFRRLTFSPDGNFLFTTAGIFKNNTNPEKEELTNTVYIFSRKGLNKPPIAHLPGFKKAVLVVSFSPIFYSLDPIDDSHKKSAFQLPYKMIYAVATQDSVFIYDTQHEQALGSVSSIHYRILTDITWNFDGSSLIVSSADGFCSLISFKEGELGSKLNVDYKTLLPEFNNKSNQASSPKLNKKTDHENSSTPFKKPKIDSFLSQGTVRPAGNTLKEPNVALGLETIKKGTEEKEQVKTDNKDSNVGKIIIDLDDEKQEVKDPKTVSYPPVKKKRVSPILLSTIESKTSSSSSTKN